MEIIDVVQHPDGTWVAPEKMDFNEARQFTQDVIHQALSLPPELLSQVENPNRATLEAFNSIAAQTPWSPEEVARAVQKLDAAGANAADWEHYQKDPIAFARDVLRIEFRAPERLLVAQGLVPPRVREGIQELSRQKDNAAINRGMMTSTARQCGRTHALKVAIDEAVAEGHTVLVASSKDAPPLSEYVQEVTQAGNPGKRSGGFFNANQFRKVDPSRSKLTRKFGRKLLKKAGLL